MSPNPSASVSPIARFEEVFVRVAAGPALALMAFAAVYDRGLANLGLGLLLFGFLIVSPRYWRTLSRNPLVWLTVLFFIWIPVSGIALAERYPEYAGIVRTEGQVWLKVAFLPMLATGFWLARVPRLMLWLPLILASGYFLRVVELADGAMLRRLFEEGLRAEFGMVATHFGMFSLLAVIGALSGTRAVGQIRDAWIRRSVYVYAVVVALVAAAGVITAQTRSVWIAAILLAIGFAIKAFRNRGEPFVEKRHLWVLLTGVGIVLASSLYAFGGIISARLADHTETILKVLTLDFERLDYNPIGYRVRSYAIGLQAWMDAPLLGHGPGVDRIRMLTASDPEMRWITHFHNEYLNILATYGVVGGGLFSFVAIRIVRGAVRLSLAGSGYRGVLEWFAAAVLVIAVFSVFGQSFTSHHMPFVIAVLGGIGVAMREMYVPGGAQYREGVFDRRAVTPAGNRGSGEGTSKALQPRSAEPVRFSGDEAG